jgi:hypothetical protein
LTYIDEDLANVPQVESVPYTVFMGLLWQFALMVDQLGCLRCCREPAFGGPLAVKYQGRLISQDLATSAVELNRIAHEIEIDKIRNVAEIGSGYGRLAYVTRIRFPEMEYCLFDIPPALVIARNYLFAVCGADSVLMCEAGGPRVVRQQPAARIRTFLPHEMELFPDGYFDLVINISSFDEMPRQQVANYFSLIDRKCQGWLYLKGHECTPPWCKVSGGGLKDMPYPEKWKMVYSGKDPFSPPFIERIYKI